MDSHVEHGAAPLEGLRVLELGHYVSGPLTGMLLADQGADVVRVLRPGASTWDPRTAAVLARGKRSITADLGQATDRREVIDLARTADVVIDNHRGGVVERLGVGHDDLVVDNPGLVSLSMPGFGRADTRHEERAWDSTVSAECGLFTDLSIAGAALGVRPTYTPLALPSTYAGIWGAIGVTALLHARNQTGLGDRVEVSLTDAAMSAAAGVVCMAVDQPARYNAPPVSRSMLDRVSLGGLPDIAVSTLHRAVSSLMPPLFTGYRCADGESIFLCAIDNAGHVARLLKCTGLTERAARLGFVDGDVHDAPPSRHNINAYRGASVRWARLKQLLAREFATAPAQVWAEVLAEAGVPAARQLSMRQWAELDVMRDSGVLLTTDHPDEGPLLQPAPQVDVHGRVGPATASTQPPSVAAETDPAQGWLAPAWNRGDPAADPALGRTELSAPLKGLRVVDLSNVIAGPSAGRVLAELGAEVTHVTPVAPRMGPRMTMVFGLDVNRGKRSVALDLNTAAGRSVLDAILPGHDVLVHNTLPRQAEKLGVDPDHVHGLDDRIVVSGVTAYGGLRPGGWEHRPSYDPVVQALTGITRRFGGNDTPMVHGIASCIDYFTGFSAAFGAVVGLLARQRGLRSIQCRTSLIRTAATIQLSQLANPDRPEPTGPTARGRGALDSVYRARNGWLCLFGTAVEWDLAHRHLAVPARCGPDDAAKFLAADIATRSVAEAVNRLRAAGLCAVPVRSASDLRRDAVDDDAAEEGDGASGRVLLVQHASGNRHWVPEAGWLRFDAHRSLALGEAPRPGEHTDVVLREAGLNEVDISRLVREGVVSLGSGDAQGYLPR